MSSMRDTGSDGSDGNSWSPPTGVVCRNEIPEGPGVRVDHDIVRNLEFLRSMPISEYEKYRGEWLAVAGGGIVAHGEDPERVHEEGCNAGRGEPFMQYVYASPEEVPFSYSP